MSDTLGDLNESRNLKTTDIAEDRDTVVTIKSITKETGLAGDGTEFTTNLLHVKEFDKPIKMNKGMVKMLASLYGERTAISALVGKRLAIYATTQDFNGNTYNVIRFKPRIPTDTAAAG